MKFRLEDIEEESIEEDDFTFFRQLEFDRKEAWALAMSGHKCRLACVG